MHRRHSHSTVTSLLLGIVETTAFAAGLDRYEADLLRKSENQFKPYIYVETEIREPGEGAVPVRAAAEGRAEKYILLDGEKRLGLSELCDLLRTHFRENQGLIRGFGRITGYRYFDSPNHSYYCPRRFLFVSGLTI